MPIIRRKLLKGFVAALAASNPLLRGQAFAAVEHKVEIMQFAFVPARLKVAPGDTVTWINMDVVPHTATASDESWDSGSLDQGQSRALVISKDMHPRYICRHHPSMVAELVIE